MKSLLLLIHLPLLVTSLTAWASADPHPAKPNLILVLSDDVGLSRVGCYGGEPFQTPELDRLAATGLRFERCYSMPLCGPSRSALLTGKYPFRTGATSNGNSEIDPALNPVIPAVLRKAGYATCAVGKLGQSAAPDDPAAPQRLGFDESMLWMGRGTPDRYWLPRYYRNGEVLQGRQDEYGPDLTHAFLVDFMKRHREQPFFVYYSAVLTHGPFQRTPDSKDGSHLVLDMLAYLDKQMGQLVAALEDLELRDRTILLFTSDNGPFGNPLGTIRGQPMLGAKGDLTEGGVRQPLIVNCPGRVAPGRVCSDLTDFTDFFPTVLELAGQPPPEGLKLDGRSIAPQILGHAGSPRPWIYSQIGKNYFIADSQYKLYGDGSFVDIRDSPVAEKTIDPAGSAGLLDARQRLQAALDELRAGASPPSRNPDRPLLRAETAPDLAADLRVLVENGIVDSPSDWLGPAHPDGQVDGARVAALLMAAAGKLRPAGSLEQALAILKTEGVVSSPAYWKQHAVPGEQCASANLTRLINKMAQRLKMPAVEARAP